MLLACVVFTAAPLSAQSVAGTGPSDGPAGADQKPDEPPSGADAAGALLRPFRGIFGSGVGGASHLLTFSTSLGGGYFQRTIPEDIATAAGVAARSTGTSELATANLTYAFGLSTRAFSFSATANGGVLYFPASQSRAIFNDGASLGAAVSITRNTTLTATENVAYVPFYYSALSAVQTTGYVAPAGAEPASASETPYANFSEATIGQPILFNQDVNPQVDHRLTSMSTVGLGQTFGRRVSAAVSYSYARTFSQSGYFDHSVQSLGGRLSYSVGRGLGMYVGYWDSDGGYTGSHVHSHNIDAGMNVNRALSLTRHVTLSFSTGVAGANDGFTTRYSLIGNANLRRDIGQSWGASIGYARSLAFLEAFREPSFVDTWNAHLGGGISRRVTFQSGVGIGRANIGFAPQADGLVSYFGSSGIRVAISRMLAFDASYGASWSSIGRFVTTPGGVLPRAWYQNAHVGLRFWAPLLNHSPRGSNASR